MNRIITVRACALWLASLWALRAEAHDVADLARLTPGKTAAQNGLWIETPLERRFNSGKSVVVADIQGPAQITMIHFAVPHSHFGAPIRMLDRDLLIRMYWDGEETPSVDCPLVDFFCDPGGYRENVNTELVNKRRGFNCYFPMPFRKSAKVELVYDGPASPGEELWRLMPCYSYVFYRTMESVPADSGYFHACWRQEGLLLGKQDYFALEAKGKGKFVGWNVTVRAPGRGAGPVDMNEKFYIDGEKEPSIEMQGIEDSFGFSWGFPETESMFPLTGWFPFLKGAAAYRWFVNDAISFEESLRVMIGFGEKEDPMFRREFSRPGSTLQLSSTCYWYQVEPHAPLPKMPPAADRAPAPDDNPFWPGKEEVPSAEDLKARNVRLHMMCGRSGKEVIHAEPGYAAEVTRGYSFTGWTPPVYHTRADHEAIELRVTTPRWKAGMLRLYIIDPDTFEGGRRQRVKVAGSDLGVFEKFMEGRWVDKVIPADENGDGQILIRIENARKGSNAVVSVVEWID